MTFSYHGNSVMNYRSSPAVDRLLTRKRAIEKRITEELKRPLPDMLKLKDLKRTRLSLKDGIMRLLHRRPDDNGPMVA